MWQFAILEIYAGIEKDEDGEPILDRSFPKEGTPADWIEQGKVAYCDGRLDDLIALTPWHVLLKHKLRYWFDEMYLYLAWRFSFERCLSCGKLMFVFGEPVGSHEHCNPWGPGSED